LRERGHQQTIVCPEGSALDERARAEGFSVIAKCPRSGDIAHAHSGRAHNVAIRATLGSPVIRVVTRHTAFPPRHPFIHRLKYTRTCHGIVAVSGAVRDTLLYAGVPDARITVIHTGVALPELPPRVARDGPFTVGHVGAFTEEKGQDIAIAAAKLLPDVRFVLAGGGPLLSELARTAPSNVSFPGFLADLADFFAAIDLFAMPSRSEAWGLAALEAMAHRVPVAASAIQGLAEIVEAGRSGWLVPPGNAEALARVIQEAAADPERLLQIGQAARDRAEQFTVSQMASETEAFYGRLLEPLRV
jgi:glycosyltransferase involved in cell wall biosynthesis